jgi:hypothetical protein
MHDRLRWWGLLLLLRDRDPFGMAAMTAVRGPLNAYAVGDARGLTFAIVGVFTDVPLFTFVLFFGVALITGAWSAMTITVVT